MTQWSTCAVLVAFLSVLPLYAQTPLQPEGPPEAAAPAANPKGQSAPARNPALEDYFRAKLLVKQTAGPSLLKSVQATATPNIFAAEIVNGWLSYHVRVLTGAPQTPSAAYRMGDLELENQLAAFAALSVAPRDRIDASLRQFGLALDQVYAPATPPFFNNARGIVWMPADRRFVLSVRGVIDAPANRCFKATVDLSSANVISRAEMKCSIE